MTDEKLKALMILKKAIEEKERTLAQVTEALNTIKGEDGCRPWDITIRIQSDPFRREVELDRKDGEAILTMVLEKTAQELVKMTRRFEKA